MNRSPGGVGQVAEEERMAIKPRSCPSGATGRHHVGRAELSIVTEMLFEEAVVQIIYIQIKSLQYSYKAVHKYLPRSKKPFCVLDSSTERNL
jgi:hypothetical protein